MNINATISAIFSIGLITNTVNTSFSRRTNTTTSPTVSRIIGKYIHLTTIHHISITVGETGNTGISTNTINASFCSIRTRSANYITPTAIVYVREYIHLAAIGSIGITICKSRQALVKAGTTHTIHRRIWAIWTRKTTASAKVNII